MTDPNPELATWPWVVNLIYATAGLTALAFVLALLACAAYGLTPFH